MKNTMTPELSSFNVPSLALLCGKVGGADVALGRCVVGARSLSCAVAAPLTCAVAAPLAQPARVLNCRRCQYNLLSLFCFNAVFSA